VALTANSSYDEVAAQYDNNAGYDVNGSVASCKLFIEACRILSQRRPTEIESQGDRLQHDPAALRSELAEAKAWLQRQQGAHFTRGIPS
jgi:hypothetical protein